MEDLLLGVRVAVRTSNMKISRRCLADYVKKNAAKSVPHMQHDYFFLFILFNQLNSLLPTTPENNDLIG